MSFLPRDLIIQTRPGMRQAILRAGSPQASRAKPLAHDTIRQQRRLPGFVERPVYRGDKQEERELERRNGSTQKQKRNGLPLFNELSPVGPPAVHCREHLGPSATQASNQTALFLVANRSLMDCLDNRLWCPPGQSLCSLPPVGMYGHNSWLNNITNPALSSTCSPPLP